MDIESFLRRHGFEKIRLEKSAVGHFILTLHYDDHPMKMILDTGAASTVLDIGVITSLNLPLQQADFSGGGIGTSKANVYLLPKKDLKIDGVVIRDIQVYAMDMTHVNQALGEKGAEKVDGAVGSDILRVKNAVLDCKNNHLYLSD